MEDRLRKVLSSYKGTSGELIQILQEAQAEFGYLPEEALVRIADFTNVAESKVFGVASFYAQFRFRPMGKNRVMVCRGTACHVRGARNILEEVERQLGVREGETTADLEYTLQTVACIGCCALAPCVVVNEEVKAKMTPQKAKELFVKKGKQ